MKLQIGGAPETIVPSSSIASATAYVPTLGFEPLRAWISRYMSSEHQYPHSKETWDFVISNGSQDLLQRIFDILLDPEDTLLIEQYTYSGALAAMWPVGCALVPVSVDDGGLDPEALEVLLETWDSAKQRFPKAIYIIPVAQNPTGTSLSNSRKKKIYKLAQRFGLVIIEDDPYWNLNFPNLDEDAARTSFWSMDVDQRVIRLESLSKLTAVGYRVGWACAPSLFLQKLAFDVEAGPQSGSGVSQLIVHELIKELWTDDSSELWKRYVDRIRTAYLSRWRIVENALEKHMKDLAEWTVPKGGMMVWLKLRGLEDSKEFVHALAVEHLVLLVPGVAFCSDSNAKTPYVRLSFSYADEHLIEPSIEKISNALKSFVQSSH
jgi:kynurenine/2-aminoadipate aminotransferase